MASQSQAEETASTTTTTADDGSYSTLISVVNDIIYSPVNLVLVLVCFYLLYKIFRGKKLEEAPVVVPQLPPLKRRDMTLQELRQYDGHNDEGRVCLAVNGKVFDVTRGGKRFYGPGGPYAAFAGRDASRGLAMFSVEQPGDEYDDLSDLNSMQMDSVREWEMQFTEKYHYVGRLLKPGEEPTDYSDDEDTSQEAVENQPSTSGVKKEE